jgi:hypothetical protein
MRSELEGVIQHEMESVLLYVDQTTQNLRRELTETNEKKNTGRITDSPSTRKQESPKKT